MISPLKYSCNMILPTTYDDTLSFYELLCKVVTKLNEIINHENEISGSMQELHTYVNDNFISAINENTNEISNVTRSLMSVNAIVEDDIPQMIEKAQSDTPSFTDIDALNKKCNELFNKLLALKTEFDSFAGCTIVKDYVGEAIDELVRDGAFADIVNQQALTALNNEINTIGGVLETLSETVNDDHDNITTHEAQILAASEKSEEAYEAIHALAPIIPLTYISNTGGYVNLTTQQSTASYSYTKDFVNVTVPTVKKISEGSSPLVVNLDLKLPNGEPFEFVYGNTSLVASGIAMSTVSGSLQNTPVLCTPQFNLDTPGRVTVTVYVNNPVSENDVTIPRLRINLIAIGPTRYNTIV